MDVKEYRKAGKKMVDYISDYLVNIRERQVIPVNKPGFIKQKIPNSAPIKGEKWKIIMQDVENIIMPGVTHWQSPNFHAYFPALNSYPAILGEMLSSALNSNCFNWASCPSGTELEIIIINWLGKMIGLPDEFLFSNKSNGGGAIMTTTSESTLGTLLASRTKTIKHFQKLYPAVDKGHIVNRLVGYCSDQAHNSVLKAGIVALIQIKAIKCDNNYSMQGNALQMAINEDKKNGLIPIWVCCTLGTTPCCSFDNLDEIGIICQRENMWLHIDAAYAGNAFICPEYRFWMKGIERADSITINPTKGLMIIFDCAVLWVKSKFALEDTFNVTSLFLEHKYTGDAIDYMNWQIPLSKRFRALKFWFVIRNFGIEGLQNHMRRHIYLASKFEKLLAADSRFEQPYKRHMGLIVFKLKGPNIRTQNLLEKLNSRGRIFCVPADLNGIFVIRFVISSQYTTDVDLVKDWDEIASVADTLLDEE